MPHGAIIRALARSLAQTARNADRLRVLQLASTVTRRAFNQIGQLDAARISANQAANFGILQDIASDDALQIRSDILDQIRQTELQIRTQFPGVANALRTRGQSTTGQIFGENARLGSLEGDALLSFRLSPEGQPLAIQAIQRAIQRADEAAEILPRIVDVAESTVVPSTVTPAAARRAIQEINQLARVANEALDAADAITRTPPLVAVRGNVSRIQQRIAPPVVKPIGEAFRAQQLEAVLQARAEITRQFIPPQR